MKTFKNILSEVAQPEPGEEKAFKDMHKVDVIDPLNIGKDVVPKTKKRKRFADYASGQDEKSYDQSYQFEESIDLTENPNEEIPMMQKQLAFIIYAAEEIMDYLDYGIDPEEWYQNKLSYVFGQMKSLHAYAEGDKRLRMMDMDREDDVYYYESAEVNLDEAKIKQGNIKLNDGSRVKVSKQDAELINNMLNDMNPKNRKEMEKVLMTDKAGFEEIVGFAREAL